MKWTQITYKNEYHCLRVVSAEVRNEYSRGENQHYWEFFFLIMKWCWIMLNDFLASIYMII